MELIEREALVREILSLTIIDDTAAAYCDAVLYRINKALAIDAAPVVYGRWIEYMPFLGAGDLQTHCSTCGLTNDVRTPYCPNCGARMNGGAGDG